MKDRIQQLMDSLSLTRTAFGERLGVSQASVSRWCLGLANPSNQTITQICREFSVSEEWLRTGYGEMFIEENDSIVKAFRDMTGNSPTDFQLKIMKKLMRLTPEQWDTVEDFFKK